jgi:two-component system cell cycle response regulator
MSARVLVVDDIAANVKLLEARLSAEYFEVVTAMSGSEALAVADRVLPDIILLDAMMPGLDGFEVCRRLKSSLKTAHIPIVMVTALDQSADRVRGLEAGADDFLTKPVSDVALVARVKSLARLKMLTDELHQRFESSRALGDERAQPSLDAIVGTAPGRVMIVDDRRSSYERLLQMLRDGNEVDVETDPHEALIKIAEGNYELAIVSLGLDGFDALRLCAQIRSLDRTRLLPLLVVTDGEDATRLGRALEIGVNDYIARPILRPELAARVRTQVKRKRFTDYLRRDLQTTIDMAVTDALTGLHNRRYMESHLQTLLRGAAERDRPLSIQMLDIDHFKAINDTYGHDAGDDVLREFADRVRANVRGIDLVCRLGGEEFVVVMPDTDAALARVVAERVRQRIAAEPFVVSGGTQRIDVTVSIGIATRLAGDSPDDLVKRADLGLYAAKHGGRNRVVGEAA